MRQRPSSRLLILDGEGRLLLFYFVCPEGSPLAGKAFWATPGGALEDGESYAEAAKRELLEETGIVADPTKEVARRVVEFAMLDGGIVLADERYFLIRVDDRALSTAGMRADEVDVIKAHRWWSLEELECTTEPVFPENIVAMVRGVL